MKILIAEDDSSLRRALVSILQKNNYTVDAVDNGGDAFDYLNSGLYDAAVLDIMMPVADGVSVLVRARKENIATSVLLLTAKSEIDDKITAFSKTSGTRRICRIHRGNCRTEHHKEGRASNGAYEDVGFRVIKVLNGEEPEQMVELATLNAPVVTAKTVLPNTIVLSWEAVDDAVEYQIFEYCENTALFRMLDRTAKTTFAVNVKNDGNSYSYVVQPISYTAICDNISAEFAVKSVTGESQEPTEISKESDGERKHPEFFRHSIGGNHRRNIRYHQAKSKMTGSRS